MKLLAFLVLCFSLLSGCAVTGQSLKDRIPLLNSYHKGDSSTDNPASSEEQAAPKAPQISPSKAALMETAQLDQF
jgi:hypothetical protein